LKRNSKKAIGSASQSDMAPGKINFLVTKDGLVDDVQLEYSCGQSSIDERMLEIVKEIPGRWKVATNAKGEKVDEKLTFFFGNQGC
jgi:outer membrane biosynthesis protein TonB